MSLRGGHIHFGPAVREPPGHATYALRVSLLTMSVLLAVLVLIAVGVLLVVVLARRSKTQLAAQLEVLPGMPTGAPIEWAHAETPEARMHRRLVELARTVMVLPLTDDAALERKVAAENRIAELDRRLIAVGAGTDPSRQEAVTGLGGELSELEAEVAALQALIDL